MSIFEIIGFFAITVLLVVISRKLAKGDSPSAAPGYDSSDISSGITRLYLIGAERPETYKKPNYNTDPLYYGIDRNLLFTHPKVAITNYVYRTRDDALGSTIGVNLLTLGIAVLDFNDGKWALNSAETEWLVAEFR